MQSQDTKNKLRDIRRMFLYFWCANILWRLKFPATILFLYKNKNLERLFISYQHHKKVARYYSAEYYLVFHNKTL